MLKTQRSRSQTRHRRNWRPQPATVSSLRRFVLVVLLMTVVVSAQPFTSLYEDFFRSDTTTAIKVGLNRCLDCKHWDSCWWGSCQIPIPFFAIYAERFWLALLVFASTFEVLVRGFTLGFGIRMLKYLFWENASDATATRANVLKSFRSRAMVSAVTGLSLAAFLHGSSIFIPAGVREEWFDLNGGSSNKTAPNSNLPLALYQYIRERLVHDYKTEAGTLECSFHCDGEGCNESVCSIAVDITSYFLGRLGDGLSYLTTTLEVLMRGFSLGFGARMLKFIFFPVEEENERKGGVNQPNEEEKDDFVSVQDKTSTSAEERIFESFKHRALVSAISGISVSAVVHGSSLFVPTHLRDLWFGHGIDIHDVTDFLRVMGCVAILFFAKFSFL